MADDDLSIFSIVDEAMASKRITKSRYDLLARLIVANFDPPSIHDPFPPEFESELTLMRKELSKFGPSCMNGHDIIKAADWLEWKIHDLLCDLEALDKDFARRHWGRSLGDWETREIL